MSDELCPKCHRPVNAGNSPNSAECTETDDDEGLCAAYAEVHAARQMAEAFRRLVPTTAQAMVYQDLLTKHEEALAQIAGLKHLLALPDVEDVEVLGRRSPVLPETVQRMQDALYDVGICPFCFKELHHEMTEPFGGCNNPECPRQNYGEWGQVPILLVLKHDKCVLQKQLDEMTTAYNVRNDEVAGLTGQLEEARQTNNTQQLRIHELTVALNRLLKRGEAGGTLTDAPT